MKEQIDTDRVNNNLAQQLWQVSRSHIKRKIFFSSCWYKSVSFIIKTIIYYFSVNAVYKKAHPVS
jgi:hypothetical protein